MKTPIILTKTANGKVSVRVLTRTSPSLDFGAMFGFVTVWKYA